MSSRMHMAWVRTVCGRIKSDFRYSPAVYDSYPWPEPTDRQRAAIETAAQGVLDARAQFKDSSLADLYDPAAMPPELTKAHLALDRAVDAAYGRTALKTEAERVAYLFELYRKITAPLDVAPPKKARKTAKKANT
jgi:hypothetical protein